MFRNRDVIPARTTDRCDDSTRPMAWGGGLLSAKSYVDVPAEPLKFDFLYTNFLPNYSPISIPFSIEKHPIKLNTDFPSQFYEFFYRKIT